MADLSPATEQNEALYETFWEDAPDYVKHNPGARHRRRQILKLIAQAKAGSLLDVGCGDGTLLGSARQARPDIHVWAGADLSRAQVERNRSRFPGVDFYVLNIENAALDRTFDVILCSEVIEHLVDQPRAVRNLAAMLSPRGRLVLTCPTGRMYPTEEHFGHVRHPTRQELERHASAAGLGVVSLQNWGWPIYKILKWATNVNAEWSLRHFANGPYSTGAKLLSGGLYWANYANRSDDARGCQLQRCSRSPGESERSSGFVLQLLGAVIPREAAPLKPLSMVLAHVPAHAAVVVVHAAHEEPEAEDDGPPPRDTRDRKEEGNGGPRVSGATSVGQVH